MVQHNSQPWLKTAASDWLLHGLVIDKSNFRRDYQQKTPIFFTHPCKRQMKKIIQKFDNLHYNAMVYWCKWLNQASDAPCIFFHNFFQNSLQKSFQFFYYFFYEFTKIKLKTFECPTSIRNYEKIKCLEHQTLCEPANQCIIL